MCTCIVYVYECKQMSITAHSEDERKISRSEPFAVGSKNQTQLVSFIQVKVITFTCCAISTFLPVVISSNSQLDTI